MNIKPTLIQIKNSKIPVKDLCNIVKGTGYITNRNLIVYSFITTYDELEHNWPGNLILAVIGCVGNANDVLFEQLRAGQYGDFEVNILSDEEFSKWEDDHVYSMVTKNVFNLIG